jgi:hypothetical protein
MSALFRVCNSVIKRKKKLSFGLKGMDKAGFFGQDFCLNVEID